MAHYNILIIEDDDTLASTLKYNLEQQGCLVSCAHNASQAKEKLFSLQYDLVILDVNLPDGHGFDLCKEFRSYSQTPIIFLTANDLEQDTLTGYELGADDYVTKPFSLHIFLKKIDALLRRTSPHLGDRYADGYLRIDFSRMEVSCGQNPVNLTPLEFRILKALASSPGTVLTRRVLLEKLWDAEENFVDEHALTAGMSRLRGKIERGGRTYIKTIYGMGYMWLGENND